MHIKVKNIFFVVLIYCFISISMTGLKALTIDDISKASEVRGYCLLKNIDNVPLSVKIEQMLFLGWNTDSINNKTISYLGEHHIGGLALNIDISKNIKKDVNNFLLNLSYNYSIPTFIYINDKNLMNKLSYTSEDIKSLNKLKINLSRIPMDNGNDVPSVPDINDKAFSPIFNFIKDTNKNKIIAIVDNFKSNIVNNKISNLNIYSLLVKAGKFNQIIIPYNGIESSVDNINYSLSEKAIKGDIRKNLNFNGVIINNILNEANILKKFTLEEIIIKAIKADNNMIFYNGGSLKNNQTFIEQVTYIIKKAIENNVITMSEIDSSYSRIINLKGQFYIIPKEHFCYLSYE